jgi:hypothetical protein
MGHFHVCSGHDRLCPMWRRQNNSNEIWDPFAYIIGRQALA